MLAFFATYRAGLGHLGLGAMYGSSSSTTSINFFLIRKSFLHSSGKQRSSIMFLHHNSVLPGLIQRDLFIPLWTLPFSRLARLQFELRVHCSFFFCLSQRSSPMVKLLVKLADRAINRHNNMSCKTCTISVFYLV